MGFAKKEEFLRYEIDVAEFAKALSHPARVAILRKLAECRECICGDLVLDLPLAQSTVSQHLKALKEIGLIKGTIEGPKSKYCINWKNFEKANRNLSGWTDELLAHKYETNCK